MTDATTIEGPTTEHTTGPYGETGCDETLHVVHEGEDVFVPFTNVRLGGYDYIGDVPDGFDVDRIVNHDGHIHAEADVPGGVVELVPEYNSATAEFRSCESWTLEFFEAATTTDAETIWTRDP